MGEQFPDAAPGEFPDAQGAGNSTGVAGLLGPLTLQWVSGNSWVVGNTAPYAVMLLMDAGQNPPAPVALDAATEISFRAQSSVDMSTITGDAKANLETVGKVTYKWAQGDIAVVGQHICQVEVTLGGATFTFPDGEPASFNVTQRIG